MCRDVGGGAVWGSLPENMHPNGLGYIADAFGGHCDRCSAV